jgi:N-acetylglucosaminyldiphosphoundecaprenol N-acetyl-beta-D-mannosaminyltransferase
MRDFSFDDNSSKNIGGLANFTSRSGAEAALNRRRVELWGALVDDVLLDEAVARIEGWVRTRRKNPQFPAQQVVVLNQNYLLVAQKDAALLEIVNRAGLVVPENIGAIHAIKAFCRPLRGRVKAIDLVHALAKHSSNLRSDRVLRLFLLGANAGQAAAKLKELYPGVQIVGAFSGKSDPVAVSMIKASRADVVLVAHGVGRQDRWINRYLSASEAVVGIGVGDIFREVAETPVVNPFQKATQNVAHNLPKLLSAVAGRAF